LVQRVARDGMERLPLVVAPLRAEHVVDELSRIGGEERGVVRPLGEPGSTREREAVPRLAETPSSRRLTRGPAMWYDRPDRVHEGRRR
jgi:hypothetical protein